MADLTHHKYCSEEVPGISYKITCFEDYEIRKEREIQAVDKKMNITIARYVAEMYKRLRFKTYLSNEQIIADYVTELEKELTRQLAKRHQKRKWTRFIETDEEFIKNQYIKEFKEWVYENYGFRV